MTKNQNCCSASLPRTGTGLSNISFLTRLLLYWCCTTSHTNGRLMPRSRKKKLFGGVEKTRIAAQPDKTRQNKKKKESPKESRKQFTNACSGENKEGWLVEGGKLYQD